MGATYDTSLGSDRDHVRLLIGDTDVSPASDAQLSDEELDAILAEQTAAGASKKYFAAADALEILYSRWMAKGKGVVEKQVDNLRLKRVIDASSAEAIMARIKSLRARGAYRQTSSPVVFKTY